jgi:SAM-dependent methyltransferase
MDRFSAIQDFHNRLLDSPEDQIKGYRVAGWSSADSQEARFETLVRLSKFKGGSVLDYGCGLGDLYSYLAGLKIEFIYRGLDWSSSMIEIARSRHKGKFEVINFDETTFEVTDYVFASGIFQYKDSSEPEYHFRLLSELFAKTRVCLCINFLSSLRDDQNKTINELYLDPEEVIAFAKTQTHFFAIDHSYHPGAGDMTLALHKHNLIKSWTKPSYSY